MKNEAGKPTIKLRKEKMRKRERERGTEKKHSIYKRLFCSRNSFVQAKYFSFYNVVNCEMRERMLRTAMCVIYIHMYMYICTIITKISISGIL